MTGFLKVQHPGLLDTYAADVATVAALVYAVRLVFPDFDYSWLVEEIRRTLPKVNFHNFASLAWSTCSTCLYVAA